MGFNMFDVVNIFGGVSQNHKDAIGELVRLAELEGLVVRGVDPREADGDELGWTTLVVSGLTKAGEGKPISEHLRHKAEASNSRWKRACGSHGDFEAAATCEGPNDTYSFTANSVVARELLDLMGIASEPLPYEVVHDDFCQLMKDVFPAIN